MAKIKRWKNSVGWKPPVAAMMAALPMLILGGCAQSAADRDFRSKVQSVSVQGGVEQEGEVTRGKGSVTVVFRDPGLDGLGK